MISSPSSVYIWSTRSFWLSKKQSAKNINNPSFCWHALLCKFRHIEIYMGGRFLLARDKMAHYNLCLQKWIYFLLLDTQGIVLRALIQEVSFFSYYRYIIYDSCQNEMESVLSFPVFGQLWLSTPSFTNKLCITITILGRHSREVSLLSSVEFVN